MGTYALAIGDYGLAAFLARPAWSTDLPLFGFLGLMIFGIAEHFVPLFAGRELERPSLATVQVMVAVVSVGIALGLPRLLIVGRLLWFGTAALFAGLLLETLRSGRIVPRPGVHREGLLSIDRRAATMTAAGTAYLLVASSGFVLGAWRSASHPRACSLRGFVPPSIYSWIRGPLPVRRLTPSTPAIPGSGPVRPVGDRSRSPGDSRSCRRCTHDPVREHGPPAAISPRG